MLSIDGVSKTYRKQGASISAAVGIDLTLDEGDFAVIHGPSGSGKSTLLLMAGGMLRPDSGSVRFGNDDIYRWSSRRRGAYRKASVGFIFQRFHLLPYLSIADNIVMPLALRGVAPQGDEIQRIAERLAIGGRLKHRPAELSVGEQQRVAVARALVGQPKLVLADEPTGNLDEANVRIVGDVLRDEAAAGRIVAMVTHNPALIPLGSRRLHLDAGVLTDQT